MGIEDGGERVFRQKRHAQHVAPERDRAHRSRVWIMMTGRKGQGWALQASGCQSGVGQSATSAAACQAVSGPAPSRRSAATAIR